MRERAHDKTQTTQQQDWNLSHIHNYPLTLRQIFKENDDEEGNEG